MLNLVHTSFLSWGKRKGSLTLSPDTTVRTGSKHRKTAPIISIFPSLGSTGSMDKNFPEWILQKEKMSENNVLTMKKYTNDEHNKVQKAKLTRVKRLTKICQTFLLI